MHITFLPSPASPSFHHLSSHLLALIPSSLGRGIRQKYWRQKNHFAFRAFGRWYICEPSFHAHQDQRVALTYVSFDYPPVCSPFHLISLFFQSIQHMLSPQNSLQCCSIRNEVTVEEEEEELLKEKTACLRVMAVVECQIMLWGVAFAHFHISRQWNHSYLRLTTWW